MPDPTPSPPKEKPAPSAVRPELYLTFDDGPFPTTELLLDVLKKHDAKATFFVVLQRKGERNTQFKSLARMVSEGHAIGNHGVDHDPMTKKGYLATTPAEVQKDFDDNARILREIFTSQNQTSSGMSIARLPGDGRFNASYVEMILKKVGVPHASWDLEFAPNGLMRHVGHVDWQGIKGLSATRQGLPSNREIALLHDSHFKGKIAVFEALIVFLKAKYLLKPMKTVPRGLSSIKYP